MKRDVTTFLIFSQHYLKALKLPRAVLSVTGGAAAVMWVLLKHCSGNELQLNPTLYAWPGDFQHPDVLR